MNIEIPGFNKTCFNEISQDVFVLKDDDISLDTVLYKYLDLSAIVDILCNKTYRIQLRKKFSDRREHGELQNPFIENLHSVGTDIASQDRERWEKYERIRKSSGYIPTSCFTINNSELYSMWKIFTSGYTGARLSISIGRFLEHLDYNGYELYIGKMRYSKIDLGAINYENYLFTKNQCYLNEEEIRIYFYPKNRIIENDEDIVLNFKGDIEFSEILLSPFVPKTLRAFTLKSIKKLPAKSSSKIGYSKIHNYHFM